LSTTTRTRPRALPIKVEGIPNALRVEHRWTVWRYGWQDSKSEGKPEGKPGRWTKIPAAKSNDPSTWLTFGQALAKYRASGWDGIEFILGDGWSGGDLDHCRKDEVLNEAAATLVRVFDCYTEVSPSATGVKLFFRAQRIGFQFDFATNAPTVWKAARPFAVTGWGTGDPTVDRNRTLDDLFPIATPVTVVARGGYPDAVNLTDDDLLLQAVGAPNGHKFLALWRGDTSAYGNDHSRADQALCCLLMFWTDGDLERVDRLFRWSGLMRDHWNASSYRNATLRKAAR